MSRFVHAFQRVGETDFGFQHDPRHFHVAVLPLVPFGARAALCVWTVAGIAALLASIAVVLTETPALDRSQRFLGVLALLAFSGTIAVIAMGQAAFLLTLPVTLAWRAARRGHPERAALWLGVCATGAIVFGTTPYVDWVTALGTASHAPGKTRTRRYWDCCHEL